MTLNKENEPSLENNNKNTISLSNMFLNGKNFFTSPFLSVFYQGS